jgi:chromosomal replication initiator protein
MDLPLDARFTFDTFVAGPANRLAVGAARRVAEAPGSAYNPLFIHGASGLGKTHLLAAIGHEVATSGAVPVVYRTAERFVDDIARAAATAGPGSARRPLPVGGLLLLDDAQLLGGRREAQEALIMVWDEHVGDGGQVVLASNRPPREISGLDERLVSRLAAGLIVELAPPDHDTRVEIARRIASERGVTLSSAVHQVLARVAFSNVRELQGAVTRLSAVQELERRDVDAEEVGDLLGPTAEARRSPPWMLNREKVLWEWPYAQDWLEESLD